MLAVNATITTNEVIGSATATITDSSVTTTSGDLWVTATNSATITATTESSVTAGGTAVGIMMAFNAIGDAFNNLLSNTINAVLGQNVLGTITPAVTSAYIQDSSISSAAGLTVAADSSEQVTSTIGNDTISNASGFANADGTTVDGMVSSNVIQAGVKAYIDNDNSTGHLPVGAAVVSAGAAVVSATDNSSDTANSEETSTNTPNNDAGAGLINGYANLVLNSYQYTDASGVQTLNFGDKVWVDDGTGMGTGSVYEYMGPGGTTNSSGATTPGASVDLSTGNIGSDTTGYNNLEYWKPLTQNNIIQAAEIDVVLAAAGVITKTEGLQGSPTSYFGLFDFNQVHSSTSAYLQTVTVRAGSVAVNATDSASITASDASVVTAEAGGGNSGGGQGYGGVIATNQVDGDSSAFIKDAKVTTTSGDVAVSADNTASISATETSSLSAYGNIGSVLAAFNVIGWSNDNFVFLTLDALLGTSSLLGTQTPDLTQAYIENSTVTAEGSVSVTATDSATITVDAGDSGVAYQGAYLVFQFEETTPDTGLSADGLIATNMIATQTNAYIDNGAGTTAVTATTGSVSVNATDASTNNATSVVNVTSFGLNTEFDIVSILDQLFTTSYAYTNELGWQTLSDGQQVFDGISPTTHAAMIYTYNGPNGALVDLGAANYATDTTDWTPLPEGAPTVAGLTAAFNNYGVTASQTKNLSGIFVMNEVRAQTTATVTGASLTADGAGGGISVAASEAAAIAAFVENNITTSGGGAGISTGTQGGAMAASGALVTNLIDASATAYVDRDSTTLVDPTLSAGSGGISVTATNAAQLDAQALVASTTGGGGQQQAIGIVLAFNSLGYDPENFLFNSIDALLGSAYLTNPDPSNATAYIHDTFITDGGDLTVLAQSQEEINATNSNAAISPASALFEATSYGYGGSLASNKVDGNASAYIDESDIDGGAYTFTIGGSLSVKANDAAGIYSNVKLVSSATVTNDGGAGLLQTELNAATPATYTTTPSAISNPPFDSATSHMRGLVFGDTVKLGNGSDGAASYDAPTMGVAADGSSLPDIIGSGAPNTPVNPGDVVKDSERHALSLYRRRSDHRRFFAAGDADP